MKTFQVCIYFGALNATVTTPHGEGWTHSEYYLIDADTKEQAGRIGRVMFARDYGQYEASLIKEVKVNE